MFLKLAYRNVRRQVGNYLIYFITVSLTVAFMFAVNSVIYSPELQMKAADFAELSNGLAAFSVLLSLIVAFVLSYATSFMLKLRKREFGTYLTLGMTRSNILRIFTLETLLLGIAALCTGVLLGLVVYQCLMMVVTALLELPFLFASYSLAGFGFTAALVGGVFLLSAFTSTLYLRRVSIYDLLHGSRKVEKSIRFPFLWLVCALLSAYAIAASCVMLYRSIESSIVDNSQEAVSAMLWCFVVLAAALILFHIGFARSVTFIFQKNKNFSARGTNCFVLRQLSGKLKANSVMLGAVAFLTVFAVVAANIAFVMKIGEDASLARSFPYDVCGSVIEGENPPVGLADCRAAVEEIAGIREEITYDIYTTGDNYLHTHAPTAWHTDGLTDYFISLSDFNALYGPLLKEPLVLPDGAFAVATDARRNGAPDFTGAELKLGEKTYGIGPVITELYMLNYVYFLAVVPDEAIQGLTKVETGVAFNVANPDYDAQQLHERLTYAMEEEYNGASVSWYRSDFRVKEYSRMQQTANSAIILVGLLYVGLVFVLMSMAVLALKTLTGMAEDRARYDLLSRLGTDRAQLGKTLFRQTGVFFFMPFAVPVLMCIPTGIICVKITELTGFAGLVPQISLLVIISALIFASIYLLYFTAVHQITKRNILREQAGPASIL